MAGLVGVARVLGLGVHGVRAPRPVALQGHGRRPSGGRPRRLLQDRLLQAKGHLQEINRHPEGLYLAGQMGLSRRKSSGAPEERKQLVGVGLEQRRRPCPGSSRGSPGEPRSHLRAAPRLLLCPVAQFLPPCLLARAPPDCAPGWGKMTATATQDDPTLDPRRGELGSTCLSSARNSGERGFWPGQLAGPV